MTKKNYKPNAFSAITKNLNWQISTKKEGGEGGGGCTL